MMATTKHNNNTHSQGNSQETVSFKKRILIDWAKDSTSHGLSNIIKSKNPVLKTVWLCCYLASCGICIYLISLSVISYNSNPVSTIVSIVDDVPATFPTITICHLSPLITDNATINAEIAALLASQNINISALSLSSYQTSASRMIASFFSNLSMSQKLVFGNTVENSVYSCNFNSEPCPSDWYEWFFSYYLGNCYKFNSKGTYKVGRPGLLPSLQLQYIIGDSLSNISNYFDSGLRILIENSSKSLPLVYENGISLSPGFLYDIKVSRTYYSHLDAPFSSCVKDLTRNTKNPTRVMEIMFNQLNFSTYSQQNCQNFVYQEYLARNCSCVNPNSVYTDPYFPRCLNSNQAQCQELAFNTVYSNPLFYFGSQCPKECDYFEYNVQVSQSLFPTKWFYENALKNPPAQPVTDRVRKIKSYRDARDNYLGFNIYYNELSYVFVQEIPYWDFFQLVSSIGGNLALFVGMSLLSFVELFELIFVWLEHFIVRHFLNKTSPTNQMFNNKI